MTCGVLVLQSTEGGGCWGGQKPCATVEVAVADGRFVLTISQLHTSPYADSKQPHVVNRITEFWSNA